MAGVAPSTVSTILNGKEANRGISSSLAEKVLKIAQKVGYTPNQVAVSLRTGSSKIIGLLVEDISNVFYASIASIIEDELKTHGYRVVYCSTKNDPANCVELINMLYLRQVDGYIITPVEGVEDNLIAISEKNKPVILIDRYFPELALSHVLVDDKKGIDDGLAHLVQRGYKNIGLVTVDLEQTQMNYREKAFYEFFADEKRQTISKRILKVPYRMPSAKVTKMIESFIRQSPRLDALFFTTNYLCIDGLKSLQRLSMEIPRDMAVLCFDDHELFDIYPPGISAICQPIEKIGKTAVTILLDQLKSNTELVKFTHELIPGKLIKRGST